MAHSLTLAHAPATLAQLFIQAEGSDYVNPGMKDWVINTLYPVNTSQPAIQVNGGNSGTRAGDHNLVNGKPWPVVKVQRK